MPYVNRQLDNIPFSIFEDIVSKIKKSMIPNFIPLHQGKTCYTTCSETQLADDDNFEIAMHAHAPPQGISQFKKEVIEKHRNLKDDFNEESLIITCGATGALKLAIEAITEPDSEILICSPQWLFISGVVKSCGVNPVEAPVFLELSKNSHFDWITLLQEKVTSKTRAIYFNTPNNPTGYSLNKNQLNDLVDFAVKNDLWVLADNAYELYKVGGFV